MSEWRTVRLKDVARNASRSFDFRGKKTAIFINTGDVSRGQFLHCNSSEIDGLPGQAKKAIKEGDILYSEIRPGNGRHVLVQDNFDAYVVSTKFMVIESRENILPEFLYHILKSPECESEFKITAESRSGTFPQITFDSVGNYEFKLPPLPEQHAIAHILGTLDDKIELNRRMNETLEAIARAMFKSWFVYFDPVRAKMSGEPPESICQRLGLTPDLLALFPERLVDSELGEIPEGWEVAPLEKLTSYLTRGVSPKYIEDDGILVLNQKCVRDGYVDTSKGRRHDPMQRKVDGRLLQNGDILVNSTGVGTLGRVAQILAIDEPTIVDSHVTVARADPEKISWNYLGITLLERQNEIEALGEGSTGQTELSRARLGTLSILVPPKLLRTHFDDCAVNLRLHTSSNNTQNVTLAQARDVLLPKLLSGELRVSNSEGVAA